MEIPATPTNTASSAIESITETPNKRLRKANAAATAPASPNALPHTPRSNPWLNTARNITAGLAPSAMRTASSRRRHPNHIRQHREDSDCGNAGSQSRKSGQKQRQQTRALQHAVQRSAHHQHVGQRQFRIDAVHGCAQTLEHRGGLNLRTHKKGKTAAVEVLCGNVYCRTRLLPEFAMADVADDADNLVIDGVLATAKTQPLAYRFLAWPELFGERPVDDDLVAPGGRLRIEITAAQKRDAERLKIASGDDQGAEVRIDFDIGMISQGKS